MSNKISLSEFNARLNEWAFSFNLELPKQFDGFHSKNRRIQVSIDDSKHIDFDKLTN